jgi:hypothetical protein
MRPIFAAVLLFAAPSFGGLASRPAYSEDNQSAKSMEGLYAALGGGGALVIIDAGNGFGYDAEARLGYSFNPGLQLYLSGSVDGATITGKSFRSELIAVFVQYHLYSKPSVGVFARAGIGIGISDSFVAGNAVGLGEAGGLGVEIGLAPWLFLTPELFYKNINLSISNGGGSTVEQVVGLQLSITFY